MADVAPAHPEIPQSAGLRVQAVRTRGDMKRFVSFPYTLYAPERFPNWVAPLRMTVFDALDQVKNPFYQNALRECFIALRGDRVVGTIAAIENRAAMRHHGDQVGYWGFFECEDDHDAARALFNAAAGWLAARDLTSMLGPVNPSTNYSCGLLVAGHENRPTFMTPWTPPYYEDLCVAAGLVKSKDLLGLWFPLGEPGFRLPDFVDRIAERALTKSRVVFRRIDLSRFESELDVCWEVYNASWNDNWGFVPMPRAEFAHMARDMKLLVRPDISFIATVDGAPAAFMLALPDYNVALRANRGGNTIPFGIARMLWHRKRALSARVMALGIKPEFRSRGVLALFTREIVRCGMAVGGDGAEASWLLEDNTLIVQPMRQMGARDRMRWRLYERAIG